MPATTARLSGPYTTKRMALKHRSSGDPATLITDSQGFTLLELTVCLVIIVALTTVFLGGRGDDSHNKVGTVARELAAEVQHAFAYASTNAGEAVIYVDPFADRTTGGGFMAIGGGVGIDSITARATWTTLDPSVNWTAGIAAFGPLGDSPAPAPAELRCQPSECWLGGRDHITYFIGSADNPRAVYALVITSAATTQLFSYDAAANTWSRQIR